MIRRMLCIAAVILVPAAGASMQPWFIRGDANRDGTVDLSDPIHQLTCLYLTGSDSLCDSCRESFDVNDDGTIDISDPIAGLTFLFLGGFRIPPPFPGCGLPADVGLGCSFYDACPPPPSFLVRASGCKTFGEVDGGQVGPGQECVEWSFEGDILAIRHINAGFNCCAVPAVEFSFPGDTIIVVETEGPGSAPCDCLCLFDLDLEIRGYPRGDYTIRIEGPLGTIEFSNEFELEPSGIFCEDRFKYPWQP